MKKVFKKINLVLLALSLIGLNLNMNLQAKKSLNSTVLAKVSSNKIVSTVVCFVVAYIIKISCSKNTSSRVARSSRSIDGVGLARLLCDVDRGNPSGFGNREIVVREGSLGGNTVSGPEFARRIHQISHDQNRRIG